MISICLAVPQVNFKHLLKGLRFNSINLPYFQTLFTLHLDETYLICVPKQDFNHLFVVSTFLLFVIPMSIITILYVLIGLQLRKSKIVQRGAVNGSSVRLKVRFFFYSFTQLIFNKLARAERKDWRVKMVTENIGCIFRCFNCQR